VYYLLLVVFVSKENSLFFAKFENTIIKYRDLNIKKHKFTTKEYNSRFHTSMLAPTQKDRYGHAIIQITFQYPITNKLLEYILPMTKMNK
jgi:hypothetical protein